MAPEPPGGGKRRILGLAADPGGLSPGLKTLVFFAVLGMLGALVALSDPEASLRHLKVGFLSGGVKGYYFAIVDRIAVGASRRKGRITNVTSAGAVENVQRLIAARSGGCKAHFALVQEGTELPAEHNLELIGRLTRPESLVILGKNVDRIVSPRELQGLRLGIGPPGSGTEALMRRLLAPLSGLQLRISTQPTDEQIYKLERGELDLGAMVTEQDADQLQEAVRSRGLQILGLPRAEAFAHDLAFLRVGRIEAGHYDPVAGLPPTDKPVLLVDTLIIGNGCASRSATSGLISVLDEIDPQFLKHNRETPNLSGLPYSTVARAYFDRGGPDLVGVYAPWVVDIMPTASWVELALGISVLFNAMGAVSRFRLWRLDANRVAIEKEISRLFGAGITVSEISRARPAGGEEVEVGVQEAMRRLETLYGRCRTQSLSIFVPMGAEMAYRYQENLILDLLQALRGFGEGRDSARRLA
jgi:TRAP-type uncharacterized transport system substrate-binding protein